MRVSVGWVVIDPEGKPYRPHRSGARSGYSWLTSPPRVYQTEGKAKAQARQEGFTVKEVFYES